MQRAQLGKNPATRKKDFSPHILASTFLTYVAVAVMGGGDVCFPAHIGPYLLLHLFSIEDDLVFHSDRDMKPL